MTKRGKGKELVVAVRTVELVAFGPNQICTILDSSIDNAFHTAKDRIRKTIRAKLMQKGSHDLRY